MRFSSFKQRILEKIYNIRHAGDANRHWVSVARPFESGFIDNCSIDPAGLIRLTGWSTAATRDIRWPELHLDGTALVSHKAFRFPRPDVSPGPDVSIAQAGLCLDYLVPEDAYATTFGDLFVGTSPPFAEKIGQVAFHRPAYDHLLRQDEPLGRPQIYGSGPPDPNVNPAVFDLIDPNDGDYLDFGCGSGAMVRAIREAGGQASGLELDLPAIWEALHDQVRAHVTLYDGQLPSPAASAETVICSEVLEHIPDCRSAVAELRRLARRRLVLTVPDIESVPLGFSAGVVPWHLLELTHVNFFTQRSLDKLFAPLFPLREFSRIGQNHVGPTSFFGSLVMVAHD